MTPRLLYDAAYARQMLDGETEKHQIHGFLRHVVVLHQICLHHTAQLLQVLHLHIVLGIRLGIGKVTVDQLTEIGLLQGFVLLHKTTEEARGVRIEARFHRAADILKQPAAIGIFNQSIPIHSQHLVHPQSPHGVDIFSCLGNGQQDTLYNPREIAQIEEIVGFSRCGEQIQFGVIVYGQGGAYDLVNTRIELLGKAPGLV